VLLAARVGTAERVGVDRFLDGDRLVGADPPDERRRTMNSMARNGAPSATGRSELPATVMPRSRNDRPRYIQGARSSPMISL
jgi:hypothetical protein